ncbi:cation-transporting ATPase [Curtobacterium sp. NPDC089689]|uniref:cation-transporting ATPase n=1 Tax=Curtobacterium sp. NPDC089689 TaxID=3363968 RepID=UPI00381F7C3B
MANLNRILGMASKVIDKQLGKRGQAGTPSNGVSSSGGTDWRDVVRSAADKLTGDDRGRQPQQPPAPQPSGQQAAPQQPQRQPHGQQRGPVDADKVAIAKYDYLLRTAPPERLEQVHHDAFARLTPGQRQEIRNRLNSHLPPNEHLRDDSAAGLARAATRGEVQRPGLLRRVLGGRGGAFAGGAAVGAGAMAIGGIGVAVAGAAVMSAAAGPVLAEAVGSGVDFEGIASGIGDLGLADTGLADLGEGAQNFLGDGEQLLGGFGEQASNLGNDFLGGLFDR